MKDINNPLIKAYYDALTPLGYPVYEGEEPDNELAKIYLVISDVSSTDASAKSNNAHNAQIQVTVNSWEMKYNNVKSMNTAAGLILQTIKPGPVSTLTATGIGIVTTSLQNDNVTNYGKFAGRVYISRNLIFSHLISY